MASTLTVPWWLHRTFFIKNQIEMLKILVSYCEGHTVLIMCPVPRYVTFRCCDDPGHCTNFDDPSYLATLISDLARVKASITKAIPEATAVDTLEALIGQGNKSMDSKEEVVKSSWSQDPVHANLHAYYKLASNTIQMIEGGLKAPCTSGGKRLRTDSEDHQRGSGSGSGNGFRFWIRTRIRRGRRRQEAKIPKPTRADRRRELQQPRPFRKPLRRTWRRRSLWQQRQQPSRVPK
jgi:hypothetical protein